MGKTKKAAQMGPPTGKTAKSKSSNPFITTANASDTHGSLFSDIPPQRFVILFEDDNHSQAEATAAKTEMETNWRKFNLLSKSGFHPLLLNKVSNTQHAKPEHLT
jgi:hypothetical protein